MGVSGNRRRSFSRGGVIAASALAHLVVLAIIALRLPKVVVRAPPAPSTVNVWLMPRLTSDLRSPATQRTTAAPAGLAAAPPRASRPAPSPGATVVALRRRLAGRPAAALRPPVQPARRPAAT